MIRPAYSEDVAALYSLAESIGLFEPHELEAFAGMISEHLEGQQEEHCWVVDEANGLLGAAYYAPEAFADGVWNLYFIGVHPDHQGKGLGTALLQYVEQALREKEARLLLVETSGLGSFELTRAFYGKNGYDEEARIREFYDKNAD